MEDYLQNGKRSLKYRLTVYGALCLALAVFPVLATVFTSETSAFKPLIYLFCAFAFIGIVTFTVVYAYVGHNLYRFRLTKNGLEIQTGFIFLKHIFVFAGKIKGVEIKQKRFIFKDLCNVVFLSDSGNVAVRDVTLDTARQLLGGYGGNYEKV